MKIITDFVRKKIMRVGQRPLPMPGEPKPVNMTRILSNPRNILIIPYNRMGTILLSSRVFKALREHFEKAKITVAVHESWSVLIMKDPTIDNVVTFGDYIENPHSKEFREFAKRLVSNKYDLAFFLSYQFDPEIAYLIRLSEATLRVSFNSDDALDYFNIGITPATGTRYEVERFLELLRTVGITGGIRDYTMSINDSIREKARLRFLPAGIQPVSGRIIGFDLTREIVGQPIGRKNAEHVIKTLVNGLNATVVVFYEPEKTTLAAELKELFGKDIILVEDRPVSMMAGMMSFCRFVVTHNTDMFQLAIALKTPVISILDDSEVRQWSPGEQSYLLHLRRQDSSSWPTSSEILQSVKQLLKQTKLTS